MIREPEQAIFDMCFVEAMKVYDDVYDFLPDAEAKYPFIVVGDTSSDYIKNSDRLGRVRITLHVWGTQNDRRKMGQIAGALTERLLQVRDAFNYYAHVNALNTQKLMDTTTSTVLLHSVIECEFNYTRKD